jgi:hypothetical protein
MDRHERLAKKPRRDATPTRSVLLSQKVQMFPTPEAHPRGAYSKRFRRGNANLAAAVRTWPTPRANDAEKRGDFDPTNPRNGLPAAVRMWPTPIASDAKGSLGIKRGDRGLKNHLSNAVKSYPTPTSTDWKNRMSSGRKGLLQQEAGGQLNPTWVEWLMGFPLGWTDSGASAMRSSRRSPKPSEG